MGRAAPTVCLTIGSFIADLSHSHAGAAYSPLPSGVRLECLARHDTHQPASPGIAERLHKRVTRAPSQGVVDQARARTPYFEP
jgi:hypothetical protein